jgi:hypothetical protein
MSGVTNKPGGECRNTRSKTEDGGRRTEDRRRTAEDGDWLACGETADGGGAGTHLKIRAGHGAVKL